MTARQPSLYIIVYIGDRFFRLDPGALALFKATANYEEGCSCVIINSALHIIDLKVRTIAWQL